ncbi:hypothetical protein [Comamonas sp. 26]|uniref:hypothetical protein n=1 Tax=Comamonas sp. 26 TaxID=2035201 RepID=UPI000C18BC1C|nr:hypothetical protein [Comamonas sp. 26]PIG09613.1 hypothetical protein CLU84_2543 [Comamonas sp. 26]
MANEIADAIRSTQSLTGILQELRGFEKYGALLHATADIQEKLSQALLANASSAEEKLTLLKEKQMLAEENKKLKDWTATARDYQLENLGYGAFAQVYKPQIQSSKPPHWACTNCFEDQKISILQNKPREGYKCPRCSLALPAPNLGNRHPE